ncbi:6273_t:CDS:10 [Cetraspora pellucida]|uniref:6273_t:CDS:1 n=1 Tax=Cetraspora pellucida TaxID=1433469 RepID=A0A9N9CF40_9GLOM|nr:6273_t:CDS:10 [Cetraspora pellucida]
MSNLGNTSDLNNVLNSSDDTFSSTLKDISKHAFKKESIRSTEKVPSAKTSIMVGQYYDTKKDILNAAQENAKNLGFAITIKSNEDITPTVTRKDISNLSTRIHSLEETASMEVLIMGMEDRGYTAWYRQIKHLFFCHEESVKNAKHFSKIVLINAIYKTNISDKSEKSYTWIIEQFASLIFFDIFSYVFVTDNEAALINAIRKIFSRSEHLLCTWHVLNNFKKNLRKYFNNDSFDKIIKIVDSFIHSRDCEALDTAITAYNKLALLSLNENEVLKYFGRMMKVREKWIGIYTSRIMHFGATTMQHVEGTHLAIKHVLETSGSLMRVFNYLDRWLNLHHEENSLQNENESFGIDPLLVIKNELFKATTYEVCLYELCVNYNISCRHLLLAKGSVMLSIILTRWLLFPDKDRLYANHQVQNLTNLQVSDSDNYFLCKSQLYEIKNHYISFPDEQQRFTLLEKLNEILIVPVINLSEIEKKKVKTIEKKQNDSINLPQNISSRVAIRGNEENWIFVKLAMSASPCSSSLWFLSSNCAQLTADIFSVPIAIFNKQNEQKKLLALNGYQSNLP